MVGARAPRTNGALVTPALRRAAHRSRWSYVALAALLVAFGAELQALRADLRVNAALAQGDVAPLAELDSPRGQLARAFRLEEEGRTEEALAAYGSIRVDDEPALRAVQRYNLANLYLRRAADLERAGEQPLAISLIELAKQNYRELLADDPDHWRARYNLTRALQMLPDLGRVDIEDEINPERSPRAPRAQRSLDQLP